ncbi:MAG: glutaminyl-peptide cyclotransferase [Deltaproteobacteria bacterium]|nr:glutaminyl-peptide cyclotransferase [Deltaproteobacteria bacterium]
MGDPKVAFIDPNDGAVKFFLDCQELVRKGAPRHPEAVLNGLALDAEGRLFLTGKLWPRLFRVDWETREANRVDSQAKILGASFGQRPKSSRKTLLRRLAAPVP